MPAGDVPYCSNCRMYVYPSDTGQPHRCTGEPMVIGGSTLMAVEALARDKRIAELEADLLAEREKVKRLADILGQMSTSCVPPLHNCGTCMRARAALAEAGEEGK